MLDADNGAAPLYRGDRLRSEGFARRLCQVEGGTITVIGLRDVTMSEYVVKPSSSPPRRAPAEEPDSRRRERRQSWPAWGK